MSEIFKALAKAQKNFEAALKGAQNPHFRSKYAALDACVDAVRGPLNDAGVFLTQTIESVENGVLIETLFAHESGETFVGGKLFMPVAKHDAQGYGSAITYGRRYSLLTACGVAPEDDDGNAATAAKPEKKIIKQAAMAGIGDDLSQDWKDYLQGLAAEITAHVGKGDLDAANFAHHAEPLDETQELYMQRFLDPKTRKAMGMTYVKAA